MDLAFVAGSQSRARFARLGGSSAYGPTVEALCASPPRWFGCMASGATLVQDMNSARIAQRLPWDGRPPIVNGYASTSARCDWPWSTQSPTRMRITVLRSSLSPEQIGPRFTAESISASGCAGPPNGSPASVGARQAAGISTPTCSNQGPLRVPADSMLARFGAVHQDSPSIITSRQGLRY